MERRATTGLGGGEAVIGEVDREGLSPALVAIHRAGLGAQVRVLDGLRGDLAGQLQRAGFSGPTGVGFDPLVSAKDRVLILVAAPGRTAAVGETLKQAGARTVHVLRRGSEAAPAVADLPLPMVGEALLDEAGR